jgi:phosphoglycolate phosphatase
MADPSIDLICFDLDGVLADSVGVIGACLDLVCAREGVAPASPDELRALVGPPLPTALIPFLHRRDLGPESVPAWLAVFRAHYAEASLATPVQPGVAAMLQALEAIGLQMVVVTSKPRAFAEPMVAAMGLVAHFDRVEGPALHHSEVKAVTLARALKAAGVRGPNAAMVGDRHHDIDAALANGTVAVGVTWGVGDRAELHAAGADTVIDHPRQLVDLVRTWNERVA